MMAGSWLVGAVPTCKQQKTDIICTAGDSDYNLTRGLVSDNNRVTGITLRACRIINVDYESFEELPMLEYLDLSLNSIKTLQLGVLDTFQNLKLLNLSYNQLTGFPLGLFDQKPNLLVLDIRGNKIGELELGILDLMKKLEHLDVSYNALLGRSMNAFIFDQTPHIRVLDFSRNDMSGAPDNLLHNLGSLKFLNLDRCFLTEVPKFAISENLKLMNHLMLSTNKIKTIDDVTTFVHLVNLEIINLTGNIIESIAENIFLPLKKLKTVILRGNRLTQIPDRLFQHFPKLIIIDLSHNLIEFVPVNAFRGSPVKYLNLASNRFTYLTDNFCLELKNSGGKLNKFFFNQNPWQCACLRDIISEVKSYGIQYNSVKFDGKKPVCVTGNQFNCQRQPDANSNFAEMYYNLISGNSK